MKARSYGLAAILVALLIPSILSAQGKGKSSAEGLRFEVYQEADKSYRAYRWRLVEGGGKDRTVVANGMYGYKTKEECDKAIETIKNKIAKAVVEEVGD